MNNIQAKLEHHGLLNTLFDYTDLINPVRTEKFTYCSSPTCAKKTNAKWGVEVFRHEHEYVRVCPKCDSKDFLAFMQKKATILADMKR